MSVPLHLLLVEDSVSDARLVVEALRSAGHEVVFERVEDPLAMRAALEARAWDAIISDWSMPGFSGLGALAVMQETGLDLPFIIVSGTAGEDLAVEAMRAGANDYLLKDRLTRLAPALERELRERKVHEARRKSESALLASEARFSRLAESGVIGIVSGDLTGSILEANDAFLQMTGLSRKELPGGKVSWRNLTAPESLAASERGFEELRVRGVATPHKQEFLRKDGSRVAALVGRATLSASRSISFVLDVTAQERAEEALRKSQEQLRHAQKMEAVGRLAGGVAHDFNNVLSVILCCSSIIIEQLLPGDPLRADVEEIRIAGQRAADLTRQLLMFSRQEAVEPRVLDLNDVLTSMDRMLQRILGEDVDLVSLRGPSLGRIRADPSHVEQIIMNLVVNSRDAMPTGGKLTIETRNVVLDEVHARDHLGIAPGRYVLLAVSDTGVGMDQATQARIFEPFFTTKATGKGTGLGLSTVFGLVHQAAGSVWVYSEPGNGTTFKVYIPRVDAAADAPAPAPVQGRLSGSETILLVEDEDQLRAVARGILRKQGYQVIEARNAGEALLLSENHVDSIDLLVTDVVMPQMSGPELARRLLKARPETKILCMSGYTDDALGRHGGVAAGIAYLQKPITPDNLARKVRAVLDSA